MRSSCITHSRLRGFTLVEVMISAAIFIILSTIIIANYPDTAKRLALANISQNISLSIREAQVRGSAIDSVNSSLGGYGIYVSRADPDQVILFGDTVDASIPRPYGIAIGNGLFETNPINETKTLISLPERFTVAKVCIGTGFPFTCNDNYTPDIDSLTVSFTRPSPTPAIYINDSSATSYSAACIELHSPNATSTGHVRNIQIFTSGMVQNTLGACDN